MPSTCSLLKTQYASIKALKAEFDSAFDKALTTGDLSRVKELKAELEQRREILSEKLWPFEHLSQKELKEQYEEKKDILQRVGLLETLSNGEIGIRGIDNKEYALPSYQEITRKMRENKEIFKTKTEQGFTEIEIIPFGLSLHKLMETVEKTILKHHKEGKLFATRKNPEDETEPLIPLELHDDCETNPDHRPLYHWEKYNNADTEGNLVYFPKEFSEENHQGKTKQQILQETKQGFQVILREKNINIPKATNDPEEIAKRTKGGRTQIDTSGTSIKKYIQEGEDIPSPEEYLKAIQTEEQYKHEEGQTPDDWLIIFLAHLEKYNQVIDDYTGNGNIAFNLGAYFTDGGRVPGAFWSCDDRQAVLSRGNPKLRDGSCGARGRVRVV